MSKYPISKEFGFFVNFTPPINRRFLKIAAKNMKVPGCFWKDPDLDVKQREIKSYDGVNITIYEITPVSLIQQQENNNKEMRGRHADMPCLLYCHGGGFVLEGAGYHYRLCMRYAKEVGCKVVFVKYRLAPEVHHPVFFEDCYGAYRWICENAEELGVDKTRIGVGGDSAGATLAVGVCMMARDRNYPVRPILQMLPYPYLDGRSSSESNKKYTDTPMWNSTLSAKVGNLTQADPSKPDYLLYSPVEAKDFSGLPPAYVETAEFDCLHDDGILYASELSEAGIEVELNETKGTMHGYDIALKAPTTQKSVEKRIEFMKRHFWKDQNRFS